MNKELPAGHSVCCFCLKSYLVSDGEQCENCGDLCCPNCWFQGLCPDCWLADGPEEAAWPVALSMRLLDCPIVGLVPIDNGYRNELLIQWEHKLGPCERPFRSESFALEVDGKPVAVAMSCSIVHGPVAGYKTQEVVELARLASCTPWANRVMLRLWRECCAPRYACWTPKAVVSYSHNGLHQGDIYRFDGWRKVTNTAGSTGKGGNWARRGRGYANEAIHGLKSLWIYEYQVEA